MKYLFLLLLFSCAKPYVQTIPRITDPVFKPYQVGFEQEAAKHGLEINAQNVAIIYGKMNLGPNSLGETRTTAVGVYIVISKNHWSKLSETQREILIFHELGHGVLDREHVIDLKGGIPSSMMTVFMLPEKTYQENREYYLDELFSN